MTPKAGAFELNTLYLRSEIEMKRNYDFFGDKEDITNEDIEDFEAHANMMQERDIKDMEASVERNITSRCTNDQK